MDDMSGVFTTILYVTLFAGLWMLFEAFNGGGRNE